MKGVINYYGGNTKNMNNTTILESSRVTTTMNKVLKNTYLLLSATLLFSAATAGVAIMVNMPPVNIFITIIGYFGLLFLAHKFSDRASGILWVFALTGFMGLTLGGVINVYLKAIPNGSELVATSLLMTGVIFLSLSAFVVSTKKDFSFLGGFLFVGFISMFLLGLAAYFLNWSTVSLAVSGGFVILSSGLILYETSNIVRGGQTNYILATITLYVAIYNLFMSLLHLLSAFAGGNE